jgi:bacterioferritin
MANTQLIDQLNEALNREISTAVRYMLQSSAIQGVRNEPLRNMYREEVQDEMDHAQYLADKIVMLGGTPQSNPDFKPLPEDVSRMIDNDLAAEQDDVAHYKKLAALAEEAGDIELKIQMEEQAADESRHAEKLRRMKA